MNWSDTGSEDVSVVVSGKKTKEWEGVVCGMQVGILVEGCAKLLPQLPCHVYGASPAHSNSQGGICLDKEEHSNINSLVGWTSLQWCLL